MKEELMASSSERKKPCLTLNSTYGSEAVLLPRKKTRQASSPDLKALTLSVNFHGWRFASVDLRSWANKMSDQHEATWREAGIYEAIMASTQKIQKNQSLVLALVEKWCPQTNSFVFPWGEATITLEDVLVLLGFPVLGLPYFAPLDGNGEKTKAKLEKVLMGIKKDKGFSANEAAVISRFMGSGEELEHVAFLASWLSYFVFPSRYYHLTQDVLSIAVHLSRGTRIALGPPVLAHLYAELDHLKTHIRDFSGSTIPLKIDLSSLFKLVLVWTWERFTKLQPEPNPLRKGEPRLARWRDLKQNTPNARKLMDKLKIEDFEWRPYTKPLENWKFPMFYPEKAMRLPVGRNLDDQFISFARCIKPSELVGIGCAEHYFPDRVASQFGILQKPACPPVNRKSLSEEAAWDDYSKPIGSLICIPSRSPTTPRPCKRGRKSVFLESAADTSKSTKKRQLYMEDDPMVPSVNDDDEELLGKTSRLEVDNNDSTLHQNLSLGAKEYETVPLPKTEQNDDETGSKAGKSMVLSLFDETISSDDIVVETRETFEVELLVHGCNALKNTMIINDGNKEQDCLLHEDGGEKASSDELLCSEPEKEKDDSLIQKELAIEELALMADKNEISHASGDETSKADESMVLSTFDKTNSPAIEIVVLPLETRETFNDELNMMDGGSTEPQCFLQEDGAMAGEKSSPNDTLCIETEKEDDDSNLIQKKITRDELALKGCSCQKLASGSANGDETSKGLSSYDEYNASDPPVALDGRIDNDILVVLPETRETFNDDELLVHGSMADDGSNEPQCLFEEDGKLCNETQKEVADDGKIDKTGPNVQSESSEKRDQDGNGMTLDDMKVMAAALEEQINEVQRKVIWLKERRAIKHRKLAAAANLI